MAPSLIKLFLVASSILVFSAVSPAAQPPQNWRKATLEVRQGDEGAVFTLTKDKDGTYLKMESVTENWRRRLSDSDAEYFQALFGALPVVPTLPRDCQRDFARAEFTPTDERPRATCLSQETKYTPKYAELVKALGFARLKYADKETAQNPPPKATESKPQNMRR